MHKIGSAVEINSKDFCHQVTDLLQTTLFLQTYIKEYKIGNITHLQLNFKALF